jgi:hypothetical protein
MDKKIFIEKLILGGVSKSTAQDAARIFEQLQNESIYRKEIEKEIMEFIVEYLLRLKSIDDQEKA